VTVAIVAPDEKPSILLQENNLDHTYQNCPVICMSTSKELLCLILKDGENMRCFSAVRNNHSYLCCFHKSVQCMFTTP